MYRKKRLFLQDAYAYAYVNAYIPPVHTYFSYFSYFSYAYVYACTYATLIHHETELFENVLQIKPEELLLENDGFSFSCRRKTL